ncbi:hypothetical protein LNP74_28155 [Klebsiella pneumoniae subsp. pneumoniae]|nr:hypothetical protein [Klebsiella pneumoniae subsp. pneumoniae]
MAPAIGAGVLFLPDPKAPASWRAGSRSCDDAGCLPYPIAFIAIGPGPGCAPCRGGANPPASRSPGNGGRAFWQNRRGGDHLLYFFLAIRSGAAGFMALHDHQIPSMTFWEEPAADAGLSTAVVALFPCCR